MASPIQAQVLAPFSPDAGSALQLLIEPDPNAYADLNVHLLLFPAVGANLAASAGSVRLGITKEIDVPPGIVTFSGSSVAQISKLPSSSAPTFKALYAFDTKGAPISVGFGLDSATGELRADAECWAAVQYSAYKARAQELIYTPLTERLGAGVRTTFGVIAAFYPPHSQTIYEVQPFNSEEGDIRVELYRIISSSATNKDGEFEYPPNLATGDGSYPGKAFVFDTSAYLVTERVHEIAYIDRRGLPWVTPYNVPIREPYVGDHSYTPALMFRENSLPADFDKDLVAKGKAFIASKGYGPKGLPSAK